MNTNEYLTKFFEEKVISEITFEVMSENGIPNFISNLAVIEQIKLAPSHEKDEIVHVLRQIDFKNGDVNHFLNHLASAMAIDM